MNNRPTSDLTSKEIEVLRLIRDSEDAIFDRRADAATRDEEDLPVRSKEFFHALMCLEYQFHPPLIQEFGEGWGGQYALTLRGWDVVKGGTLCS